MAKYLVQLTDDTAVELDTLPGTPALRSAALEWEAGSEVELREMVVALGFDAATMDPAKSLHVRYGVPLTRDGERIGQATVNLWLGHALCDAVMPEPPIPAMARLVADAKRERVAHA